MKKKMITINNMTGIGIVEQTNHSWEHLMFSGDFNEFDYRSLKNWEQLLNTDGVSMSDDTDRYLTITKLSPFHQKS